MAAAVVALRRQRGTMTTTTAVETPSTGSGQAPTGTSPAAWWAHANPARIVPDDRPPAPIATIAPVKTVTRATRR